MKSALLIILAVLLVLCEGESGQASYNVSSAMTFNIIILFVIAWSCFWDAVRDSTGHDTSFTIWWLRWALDFAHFVGMTNQWGYREHAWHWFKWASFYPPQIVLMVLLPVVLWPVAVIVGFVFWQLGGKACGKKFGSHWF